MTRASESDEEAVSRVIQRALRMTPESCREDALQEARLALWLAQQKDDGKGDPTARHVYLRMRVRSALIDEHRRRTGRRIHPKFSEFSEDAHPQDDPDIDLTMDTERMLRVARGALTSRQWRLMQLHYARDVEQIQIAEEYGVGRIRVSRDIKRAKTQARAALEAMK